MPDFSPTAVEISEYLASYLGAHAARVAVRTFSARALKVDASQVRPEHIPELAEAIRPILRIFAGEEATERAIRLLVIKVCA